MAHQLTNSSSGRICKFVLRTRPASCQICSKYARKVLDESRVPRHLEKCVISQFSRFSSSRLLCKSPGTSFSFCSDSRNPCFPRAVFGVRREQRRGWVFGMSSFGFRVCLLRAILLAYLPSGARSFPLRVSTTLFFDWASCSRQRSRSNSTCLLRDLRSCFAISVSRAFRLAGRRTNSATLGSGITPKK